MDYLQTHQIELKPQAKKLATTLEALNAGGKQAVLVIFQALDAAGKDSTIRNVFRYCDPGYTHVASFKAPSKREAAHDFMWRCYQHFPAKGQLQVFNRSYYEETLVVRVHPEFLKAQGIEQKPNKMFWKKRFDFIRQTENHLLNSGTKVIKFFPRCQSGGTTQAFYQTLQQSGQTMGSFPSVTSKKANNGPNIRKPSVKC